MFRNINRCEKRILVVRFSKSNGSIPVDIFQFVISKHGFVLLRKRLASVFLKKNVIIMRNTERHGRDTEPIVR